MAQISTIPMMTTMGHSMFDAWPNDACASIDTDNDGQPDDLHCPPGMTTWLTVDPDDDGDGIPDISEGAESGEDSESSSVGTVIFVLIFLGARFTC